jgi:hypothetical protein
MAVIIVTRQLNRRWRKNHTAVLGFFDAILFLAVMILAVAVINLVTIYSYEEVSTRDVLVEYTESTRDVLLRTTINDTYYILNDERVVLEDKFVLELLLEDLYLRLHANNNVELTSLKNGIEHDINSVLYNLTAPYYHYALHVLYKGELMIKITDSDTLPIEERYASSIEVMCVNDTDYAIITLYIWKA